MPKGLTLCKGLRRQGLTDLHGRAHCLEVQLLVIPACNLGNGL